MTIKKHVRRSLLERIYEKLLKKNTSRTITFDNFKDIDSDFGIRDFNKLFEDLGDLNYTYKMKRTNTWHLVEDDPKKYNEVLDVPENFVENLEKIHGRKNPDSKGAVVKGSMKDQY